MLLREGDDVPVFPTSLLRFNSLCELSRELFCILMSYLLSFLWFNYLRWHFNKLL